jgi:hypothetical protein
MQREDAPNETHPMARTQGGVFDDNAARCDVCNGPVSIVGYWDVLLTPMPHRQKV